MTVAIAASLAGASTASASTSAFYSVISNSSAGDPVSATALFGLDSAGNLTLTLTNLITNINGVGQAITGIKFNLSTLTGSATPATKTGDLISVSSASTVPTDLGVQTLTGWSASTTLPTVTLTTIGFGQPDQAILGPANSSGLYANAGGSIVGNAPHDPFVKQTATFTFTNLGGLTGRDINAILSNVQIGFGTAGTNYITATTTATPEPGSIALCLGGLGLLAAGMRKRRA